MFEAAIAIFSIILGFALGAAYQEFSAIRLRERIKKALLIELRSNLYILPQKKDIVEQIIKSLSEGRCLFGDSVTFLTDIYSQHYATIVPYLTPKERASFHVIYGLFDVSSG